MHAMDEKSQDKQQRLLASLEHGMVMVHLDARRPGVSVPEALKGENHLRLNLSYKFDPPDLMVNDWGIRSTLSFSGKRFRVAIPWNALFALRSHVTSDSWLYPDDMPKELLQQTPPQAGEQPPSTSGPPPVSRRASGQLRALTRPPAPGPAVDAAGPEGDKVESPEPAPEAAPAPAASSEAADGAGAPRDASDGEGAPSPEEPKPRGRGHLRVVK
jgi:stringent starvation protein B